MNDGIGRMNQPGPARERIREFVTPIAHRVGVGSFSDEQPLITGGIIGSVGVFRLVSFLEETFSVRIDDQEIVVENLDSIDKISRFLVAKLGPGSPE